MAVLADVRHLVLYGFKKGSDVSCGFGKTRPVPHTPLGVQALFRTPAVG